MRTYARHQRSNVSFGRAFKLQVGVSLLLVHTDGAACAAVVLMRVHSGQNLAPSAHYDSQLGAVRPCQVWGLPMIIAMVSKPAGPGEWSACARVCNNFISSQLLEHDLTSMEVDNAVALVALSTARM